MPSRAAATLCMVLAVLMVGVWSLPAGAASPVPRARASTSPTKKKCTSKKRKGTSGKHTCTKKTTVTTRPKLGEYSGPTSQGTAITLKANTGVVQLLAGLSATLACADGSNLAWSSTSQVANGAILSALTDSKGAFTGDQTDPTGDSLHLDGKFTGTKITGHVEIKSSANGGCDAKLTYTAMYRSL